MNTKKHVLCNPLPAPDPFDAVSYSADLPAQIASRFTHNPAALAIVTKAWVKREIYEAWIREIHSSGGALCVEMCYTTMFERQVAEAVEVVGDIVTAERLVLVVHAFQTRVIRLGETLLGGRFAVYVGAVEAFGEWFAELVLSEPEVWGEDKAVRVGGECVGVDVDDTVYSLTRTGFTPEVVPAYCPW